MKCNLSLETIYELGRMITGDPIKINDIFQPFSPYRTGPELVDFFNQFGSNDAYYNGFPSRWKYVEEKLKDLNNSEIMKKIIEKTFDPRRFYNFSTTINDAIERLNKFLKFDGYQLIKVGDFYKLSELQNLVEITSPSVMKDDERIEYVKEQIEKCRDKIAQEDYDGAITNARTLLETVLTDIEKLLSPQVEDYDGDLVNLYKRVQKLLNLHPSQKNISNSLREILTGLISIVNGLSSLRNKMSDAHVRTYKPTAHHARLAVNSTKTIVDFIFGSFIYQQKELSKKAGKSISSISTEVTKVNPDNNCFYCSSGLVPFGEMCPSCGEISTTL